jgi:hypothetical protein
MSVAPVAHCLNCAEDIVGDAYEFEGYAGRCFCEDCINSLGAPLAFILAKCAPDSAWMTDVDLGTFVTGQPEGTLYPSPTG